MRRPYRTNLTQPAVVTFWPPFGGIYLCLLLAALTACDRRPPVPSPPTNPAPVSKTAATVRADSRAYDGAPPTIPHTNFGIRCTQCHNDRGLDLPGVGFAPPAPHVHTDPPGAFSRCNQCHVFVEEQTVFAANDFAPLRQNMRKGKRLNPLAPPVIPHQVFLRENCNACHSGPAAREPIRWIRCRLLLTATCLHTPEA